MKRRHAVVALASVALTAGAACQQAPRAAPATGEIRSGPTPSTAAPWRVFEPPADGRLTATQVEMYVAVRRQAALLASPPGRGSSAGEELAEIAASERRAVKDLGQDADEYRWVVERVAEASRPGADGLGGLAGVIEASARKSREQVLEKAAGDQVPVASAEKGEDDSALAFNRGLVDRYRSQIESIDSRHAGPLPAPAPPRS
jgi:hypothetical protein